MKAKRDSANPMYQTSDLALSAFLQTLGHKIDKLSRDGSRGVFSFGDTSDLQEDIMKWCNGESVSLNVRAFVNNLRDLKGMVGI